MRILEAKKYHIIVLSLSLLASCGKFSDVETEADTGTYSVKIESEVGSNTKTGITGVHLNWSTNDMIGVFADDLQTNMAFKNTSGNSFGGKFNVLGIQKNGVHYVAYYPYDSGVTSHSISSKLARIQKAPFDGNADFMISDVLTEKYDEVYPPTLSMTFNNHLFSIVRIDYKNSSSTYQDEVVESVKISTSAPNSFSGDYSVDVSGGSTAVANFVGSEYPSVSMVYPAAARPEMGLNVVHTVYAVVRPSDNIPFKITINTLNIAGSTRTVSSEDFKKGRELVLPVIDFAATTMTTPYKYPAGFMGDSITQQWYSTDAEYFSTNKYLNKGVSAETSSQMLSRFSNDIVNNKPRCVVILAGTNDIGQNQGYISNEGIMDNLTAMVDLASADDIHVFLCSVLPVTQYGWRPVIKDPSDHVLDPMTVIQDLNQKIKAYCDTHTSTCTYVDYYSQWVNNTNSGPKEGVTYDGVHPTLYGCRVLEGIINPLIQSLD